jgi:hypothetical protein
VADTSSLTGLSIPYGPLYRVICRRGSCWNLKNGRLAVWLFAVRYDLPANGTSERPAATAEEPLRRMFWDSF